MELVDQARLECPSMTAGGRIRRCLLHREPDIEPSLLCQGPYFIAPCPFVFSLRDPAPRHASRLSRLPSTGPESCTLLQLISKRLKSFEKALANSTRLPQMSTTARRRLMRDFKVRERVIPNSYAASPYAGLKCCQRSLCLGKCLPFLG